MIFTLVLCLDGVTTQYSKFSQEVKILKPLKGKSRNFFPGFENTLILCDVSVMSNTLCKHDSIEK